MMRPILPLIILAAATTASMAQTQPYRPPYAAYPGGVPAAIADQHRYENERLRLQAQTSAALARQQQAETRQRRLEIEAARDATVAAPLPSRPLYAPEQERALRQGAALRREQTQREMGQIDAWLDRPD